MPNPHNRDLKQSVLNFGTKVQATTPSLSSASSGPARSAVASGALRFTPYEAAAAKTPPATAKKFRTPTMLRPCAVARQAQANGMGLKKSDSGSKIVIDLTSGTAAAASRATAGGGWSSTPRAAAPPRSNGWSNPSPSTTTIPTLSRAPTTTMSSTTAAAVRRAAAHSNNGNINGNTTMGALARSAGLEEGFGSNERYRPKHREVFMDDLLSENQPQSGGRHTKALNMDGTRGAFKPVKEKIFLLSGEQEMVSQLVVEKRESLFFTGSAGTGKSVLLRELITRLQCKYSRDEIGVTASTGIAACNIGGTTLHSFAGCGLGKEPAEALARRCVGNKKTCTRWRKCKVLIIDESGCFCVSEIHLLCFYVPLLMAGLWTLFLSFDG
ncbi:PIF1-like helicase-domain-containing protein [Geranomyces variabilis]|nr:PIF1-like helicase-domain-containing protein [Geranomyces variabilis]